MTVLTIVTFVHVTAGLTAVACGAAAMLAPKRPGRHPRRGRVYLSALIVVAGTATVIVLARPRTAYLLILGAVALAAGATGYLARRMRWHGWIRHHLAAMTVSYTALLTAFYVDNGPRLPLWRLLPPITFWFLPTAIALPLLVRALRRQPRRFAGGPGSAKAPAQGLRRRPARSEEPPRVSR